MRRILVLSFILAMGCASYAWTQTNPLSRESFSKQNGTTIENPNVTEKRRIVTTPSRETRARGERSHDPKTPSIDWNLTLIRWNAEKKDDAQKAALELSKLTDTVEVKKMVEKLEQDKLLTVNSSVQLIALDNQPSYLQFGERKARVTGVSAQGGFGGRGSSERVNNVSYEDIGTIFAVTSTVADNSIWAEIDFEKSYVGEERDGVAIIETADRTVRSPSIHRLKIQNTIRIQDKKTLQMSCYSSDGSKMLMLISADVSVVGQKTPAVHEK